MKELQLKAETTMHSENKTRIKRKCIETKDWWLDEQCREIQDLEERDSRLMYDKIWEITEKRCINGRAKKAKMVR